MNTLSMRLAVGLAVACASIAGAAVEIAPPPREIYRSEPRQRAVDYRRLFEKVGRAGLPELTKDKDTGLALHASWELHKRLIPRADVPGDPKQQFFPPDTYDPEEIGKFLTFLKERTKAPVPDWWAKGVSNLSVKEGEFHLYSGIERARKDLVVVEIEDFEQRVRKGVTLTRNDKWYVYKSGDSVINVPRPQRPGDLLAGDTLLDLPGKQITCIGAYSSVFARHYRIGGFDATSGKPLWTAQVWALASPVHTGPSSCHRAELTANGDTVFVFGEEIAGLYLEAFDLKTGACQFRFCTSYWWEWSEKWDIK